MNVKRYRVRVVATVFERSVEAAEHAMLRAIETGRGAFVAPNAIQQVEVVEVWEPGGTGRRHGGVTLSNPRERTERYERIRVRSPKQFVKGSFRTIDPGRPGHTKLVIGRLKKGRKVTRGRRKGRPAMTVQAVLRERKPKRIVKSRRRNPAIAVLGNPRGAKHLGTATRLDYTHAQDRKPYRHDFKPAVNVTLLDDGRVVLWHPQHKLWDLFDVK